MRLRRSTTRRSMLWETKELMMLVLVLLLPQLELTAMSLATHPVLKTLGDLIRAKCRRCVPCSNRSALFGATVGAFKRSLAVCFGVCIRLGLFVPGSTATAPTSTPPVVVFVWSGDEVTPTKAQVGHHHGLFQLRGHVDLRMSRCGSKGELCAARKKVLKAASFRRVFICSWLLCQREATLVRAENTSLGVEGASESAVDPERAHVRKERRRGAMLTRSSVMYMGSSRLCSAAESSRTVCRGGQNLGRKEGANVL